MGCAQLESCLGGLGVFDATQSGFDHWIELILCCMTNVLHKVIVMDSWTSTSDQGMVLHSLCTFPAINGPISNGSPQMDPCLLLAQDASHTTRGISMKNVYVSQKSDVIQMHDLL